MGVDIVGQRGDLRRERVFIAGPAAVAMELDVGQMAAVTLEELHGLEGGRPVAGEAEVVGVDMHRVRQLQLVDRPGDGLDDLTGRHSEVIDERVDGLDVAGRPALPHLDTAGIDDLGGIRLRRRQQPADERLHLLRLPLLDRPHEVVVIAHQDVEAFVDAGSVRELLVSMTGGEGRNGRVEGRRVTQPGVLVAGGERAGHASHRAAARVARCDERAGRAFSARDTFSAPC